MNQAANGMNEMLRSLAPLGNVVGLRGRHRPRQPGLALHLGLAGEAPGRARRVRLVRRHRPRADRRATGSTALSQPWNPWVSLLPFTVLLLSTWSAFEGDRWAPVLAVAAGVLRAAGARGLPAGDGPAGGPLPGGARLALVAGRAGPDHDVADDPADGPTAPTTGVDRAHARRHRRRPGRLVGPDPRRRSSTAPTTLSKLIDNFSNPSDPPIGLGRGIEAVLQSVDPFGPWVWGGAEVGGSIVPGLILVLAWLAVAGRGRLAAASSPRSPG